MRAMKCFFGGQMRTLAQETAPLVALRHSQKKGGPGQSGCDFT